MKICNTLVQNIFSNFFHKSWLSHCCVMCKILMWSIEHISNQSTANFDRILNSIKILLVGWEPGVSCWNVIVPAVCYLFHIPRWVFPILWPGVGVGGVTKPIFSVPLFSAFFNEWLKQWLPVWYQVHIWQVSPQLSCGDTWQIWTWLKLSDLYFC